MDIVTGNIFDIQRYSIHDGAGIRTTVFFKGCPLRCKWCSNPESWGSEPTLFFSKARCIRCGSCAAFDGITMGEDGPVIDRNLCTKIEDIAAICPTQGMTIKGKRMTVEAVMNEIVKDISFYRNSNGGVTLSGGEVLLQPRFARELLKECKQQGIHTIIETEGAVSWEAFEMVLPYVDSFFFDVKLADSVKHKQYTGAPNDEILSNLKKLINRTTVCVRIPVIPGVNDNKEELGKIAKILRDYKVTEYELLSFHQYGKGKYTSCGIEYSMADASLPEESFHILKEYFDNTVAAVEREA